MKKAIPASLLSFLLGTAVAAAIFLNPMGWSWADEAHHYILSKVQGPAATPEGAPVDGQLWTCGMHPQVIQDEPGSCPICGMDLTPVKETGEGRDRPSDERKILYYQAPMDPTYTSDKPGKSPMGMDLVPVYADEVEGPAGRGNVVKADPSFLQTMGVETAEVTRTDIPFTVRSVGTVTFNNEQLAWVTTKYEGWIETVYVNYIGEPVQKGQKLFEIYSPRLVTTQKEYLDALEYAERLSTGDYEDIKKRASSLLESTRERLAYWDITDEQIAELEKSRQPKRTLTVFSSTSGMVVEKMSESLEGMFVRPGMNLYKIVDLSTIWVEAEVFENQIPWLKIGQTALLEFPYQPGRQYRGRIRFIYPYFDSKTRTLKVSIALPNPGLEFRKDMYVNVTFDVPSAKDVLTVPEEAVLFSGERNLVVISLGEGEFQVREVTLGLNGSGLYEVRSGVEEGEVIVVSSQFLIDSESRLKEAISKLVAKRRSGAEKPSRASAPLRISEGTETPNEHKH